MHMYTDIKTIEDLSLNAWPSFQMLFYDGWIMRYSAFYTHRTNCVEQIGASILPLEEKIPYCERIYRRWKTPCMGHLPAILISVFLFTLTVLFFYLDLTSSSSKTCLAAL